MKTLRILVAIPILACWLLYLVGIIRGVWSHIVDKDLRRKNQLDTILRLLDNDYREDTNLRHGRQRAHG
jgi:hypothetical protein